MRQRTELSTVGRHDPVPQETVKQPEGSHQKQICQNVIQAGVLCKMKDGRTLITQAYCAVEADVYLHCIQKGIHFPSNDYNKTRAVLFICLKAQMICIDSLFIYCWTQHRINERKQNGFQLQQAMPFCECKMMKASNWEERNNQRPLTAFCEFKNRNGKHFMPRLAGILLGLQIRLVNHTNVQQEQLHCPYGPKHYSWRLKTINICEIHIWLSTSWFNYERFGNWVSFNLLQSR